MIATAARNEILRAFTSWTLDVLQPSLIDTIGESIDGDAILRQHREIQRAIRLRPARRRRACDAAASRISSGARRRARARREDDVKAAIMREYHRPLELVERPRPEPVRADDVLVRIGGAGVCATDLHAMEGLMESAGVTLPRVLGHENAGWVEEVGERRHDGGEGRRGARLPALQLRPLRRLPPRQRHALRAPPVHRACRSTAASPTTSSSRSARSCRLPAGVEPAAVAPHADAGLTAYHAVRRLAHLAVPGHDGGRHRRRRRRPHRAAAAARARRRARSIAVDTDERRRALAAELGADEVIDGAARSTRCAS